MFLILSRRYISELRLLERVSSSVVDLRSHVPEYRDEVPAIVAVSLAVPGCTRLGGQRNCSSRK